MAEVQAAATTAAAAPATNAADAADAAPSSALAACAAVAHKAGACARDTAGSQPLTLVPAAKVAAGASANGVTFQSVVLVPAADVKAAAAAGGTSAAPAQVQSADPAEHVPAWADGEAQFWQAGQGDPVEFRAYVVKPGVGSPGELMARAAKLPMAVYLPGLGESPKAVAERLPDWRGIAPEPFVLAVPCRPRGAWWFINDTSAVGWVRGEFQVDLVRRYCAWIAELTRREGIDGDRVGLFGYSAGAYACLEILALGCGVPIRGVGIGGVHGHGQFDTSDIKDHQAQGARRKFDGFLKRLRVHQGVPWLEATHGLTDLESKWEDAQRICEVLDQRQTELRLPALSLRKLAPEQQDINPSKKRNRTHHNYFGVAFLRADFLRALFGGTPPEPHKVEEPGWGAKWGAPWKEPQSAAWPAKPQGGGEGSAGRSPPEFEWDAGFGSGRKRKWRRYSEEAQSTLSRAFTSQDGRGKARVTIEGYHYTVDFDAMSQVAEHSGYERRLRVVDW